MVSGMGLLNRMYPHRAVSWVRGFVRRIIGTIKQ
jgi:hypothetical protein